MLLLFRNNNRKKKTHRRVIRVRGGSRGVRRFNPPPPLGLAKVLSTQLKTNFSAPYPQLSEILVGAIFQMSTLSPPPPAHAIEKS